MPAPSNYAKLNGMSNRALVGVGAAGLAGAVVLLIGAFRADVAVVIRLVYLAGALATAVSLAFSWGVLYRLRRNEPLPHWARWAFTKAPGPAPRS
jgi:hypothetical protein